MKRERKGICISPEVPMLAEVDAERVRLAGARRRRKFLWLYDEYASSACCFSPKCVNFCLLIGVMSSTFVISRKYD
ncbi:unnamed protein product [Linum trigynum]|uniref:Uncharacterized protein n=1 Tax=Linum trigynum TaxID=586398 RepID=A0AAV2EWI3_9ROSI